MTAYGQAERKLGEVRSYLSKHYDFDTTTKIISPMSWYILTGRASRNFCILFGQQKAFMIARRLVKGGSYEDVIARINAFMGYRVESF